jgi:hypothetical protein
MEAGNESLLLNLLPELKLHIFLEVDDFWTVTSLRLTCRDFDDVYTKYKDTIYTNLIRRLVEVFYEYYAFLTTIHINESALQRPPPSGWPLISNESFKASGKTDLLADVLKHLPYLLCEEEIDFKCRPLSYANGSTGVNGTWVDAPDGDDIISPNTVVLTSGYESGGINLLLNVMTSEVYEQIIRMEDDGYSGDVREYFKGRMESLKGLHELFIPEIGNGSIIGDRESQWDKETYNFEDMERQGEPTEQLYRWDEASTMWARHLYIKFGWGTENWKGDDCMNALSDFADRMQTRRTIPLTARRQPLGHGPHFTPVDPAVHQNSFNRVRSFAHTILAVFSSSRNSNGSR